jgi:hypothetical protein
LPSCLHCIGRVSSKTLIGAGVCSFFLGVWLVWRCVKHNLVDAFSS